MVLGALALSLASSPMLADDDGVASPALRTVVAGSQYKAGGVHRWLWGADYRDLWTAAVTVDVLDLHAFAGGLEPVRRVGGQETKGLALKGADGRDYTFRAIDKDPTTILPEELRDTLARGIVQDQIGANHPASFFVVDELMKAAGILRAEQQLIVMPDDPSLGEFRKEFAGLVGQLFEFAGAKSDTNPGFSGAMEVLKHEPFYARLKTDPSERADARAFLKARLFDILIGDWDRHRDQWRWVKMPGVPKWQPLPEDRDQAFSRYEGLVLTLARPNAPILQNYGATYPGMKGLTWNGWEQDRELLAGLERPVFQEVARELQSQITDAVVQRAAHRMPPEYFKIDGGRLVHDLVLRRNRLPEAANAYYGHLADKVRVYLTDAAEYVEVKRLELGDTLVQVSRLGADGQPAGEPFYQRTLHHGETQEVQIYLRGGDDRVVTVGKPDGVEVRVIGGPGHDVVDDTRGGGTRFYAPAGNQLLKGPGSTLDTGTYAPPPPPENAQWIPPRDWGRDTLGTPWLGYGSDLGLFLGYGIDTRSRAFRKDPYANRQVLRAGWSFGDSTYRADYRGTFRFENSGSTIGLHAYASGIESSRFFGYGNESVDGGNSNADIFKVKQDQFSFTPTVSFALAKQVTLALGPTVKYARTTHTTDPTLINTLQPYGYGDFGELGGTALLQLDTRAAADKTPGGVSVRTMGYPRSGVLLVARGLVYPKAWDVDSTFGSVAGSASAYLTPGGNRAPTLALRAGGQRVFGTYPFFEAAYLGGGIGGITATMTEGTVRGLQQHRYAGNAVVFGNADLRLPVCHMRVILPGEWGLVTSGDVGRVYSNGEDSTQWHYSYGAGLWLAWLDRANALTLSYARSEGRNGFYVRVGFGF
jgi:hypothetical protein